MDLYPYQRDAINALWRYWKENPKGSPLIVCPTGGGKSLILSSIISQISAKLPRFRFLLATHTKEIVSQNAKELQGLMSGELIGIYSAGLGSKNMRRVTFANVQSIYKKARELTVDMLIVDEAHLISQNEKSMYQTLISLLQKNNHRVMVMGLTATPMRMDQGSLISDGSTFTDIAYNIGIRELIDGGYLCPLVSMAKNAVDLSGVHTSGYDYNQGEMQEAFDRKSLVEEHCKDIIKCAGERRHWLIFCTGIKHAQDVSAKLMEIGIAADYVSGDMLNIERDQKIARFKDGTIRALCNVGVLTTGFNFRPVDCVVLLRATKSASLYIQCVGRGTRTADGKTNCLVLDYGGNIERHGPIDMVYVKPGKSKKAEVGVAPFKRCPMCGCCVATKVTACPNCDYLFPEPTKELEMKPSAAPILSAVEEIEVTARNIMRHQKDGKPDSLKIVYYSGMRTFMDFLCFEHGGFASTQAAKKWWSRGGVVPAPKTIAEALHRSEELPPVRSLKVIKRGKYHEILSVEVESKQESAARKEREQQEYNESALW